jgi:NAD(P)-dependent dehydrogenase (short-subunit alcohol dehydrogenase family)
MSTVLISGASRGIGLEFARQYAAEGWRVHATSRAAAPGLEALAGDIHIHVLDVTDGAALAALAAALAGEKLDVLIANAGIYGPEDVTPEKIDRSGWLETFAVNAIAPIALAGAFRGTLARGAPGKAVAISSRMGSIAQNSGGHYVYRSSKAALNAAWRSLSIEWKPDGIACAVLHPGWVQTDMGGPGADISVDVSVSGLRRVIAGLDLAETGGFLNYDGKPIPW